MYPGLIRGAVVDADNFNVPESLAYQAIQAAVHVGGYIVAGNNDGNIRDHRGVGMCVTDLQSVVNDNFCKTGLTESF